MTPMEAAAIVAGVTASGLPFALAACHAAHRALDHRTPEWRAARARAQDDRDLLRLARNTERNRHTMNAARADRAAILAADDPERSPDWCHRHGCHRSACPTPD